MFVLEKHPYNKTIIVKKDGEEQDKIHYDTVDELFETLKKYYSNELLEEKECMEKPEPIKEENNND